jgi:DMSO reductase anchor subunit
MATAMPVELIPPVPQRIWRLPAVLNFALGGLGAGFYVASVLAARLGESPSVALASWLGPALVLAGFAAVATEAGRPLRGARVLARVRSSWMSREAILGVVFVATALCELAAPGPTLRAAAALAALGLAAAQGLIVRRARAVVAWDVPVLPYVFVASALESGAGLLLVVEAARGALPGADVLGGALAVVALGTVPWLMYLTWSDEPGFARALAPLRTGTGAALGVAARVIPVAALALALVLPAPAAAPALAGAVIVLAQLWTKWALIRVVATLRPVTLGRLEIQRRVT